MTEQTVAQKFLASLTLGPVQKHDGLRMFPLLSPMKSAYEYLTLDEALAKGLLVVREMKSETVGNLEAENTADLDILVMDGEELVGARQNRIVNTSILIPAKSAIVIPVSCVEHGRWGYRDNSLRFKSPEMMAFGGLRASKMETMTREARAGGAMLTADQGEVWNRVASVSTCLGVESSTGAMDDIHTRYRPDLETVRKAFKPTKGQIGGVFCLGGHIMGADIFDKPETFAKIFGKLLDSYTLELIAGKPDPAATVKKEAVAAFLAAAAKAATQAHKSPGAGVTLSIREKAVVGSCLVAHDTAVHTALFRREEETRDIQPTRMASITRRRKVQAE